MTTTLPNTALTRRGVILLDYFGSQAISGVWACCSKGSMTTSNALSVQLSNIHEIGILDMLECSGCGQCVAHMLVLHLQTWKTDKLLRVQLLAQVDLRASSSNCLTLRVAGMRVEVTTSISSTPRTPSAPTRIRTAYSARM
eukprot:2869552-Amphidinium_carterae.1